MSLLLQALQKAARNRESVQPDVEITRSGLELEPGEIEPGAAAPRAAPPVDEPPAATRSAIEPFEASPQQAAAVLGASAREPRPRRLPGFNLRPVPLFASVAGLFLVGYGVYVYIAVSNPGLLTRTSRGPSSEPRPLVTGAARPPAAAPAGAPMPDLLEPPPAPAAPATASPAAVAPVVKAEPAAGENAPKPGAAPPAAPASAEGSSTLALNSADDLATVPRPGSRAAAPRRPTAPGAADTGDEVAPPPRSKSKARAAGGVPMVPAEERVTVQPTEPPRGLALRLEEAWGHAQRGRLAEAEAGYEAVLALDRRNVDALLGLASIAWQQGRTERAGEFYGRVVELDPQNAAAQSGLIGLLGLTDPVASETRLRDLIAREPSGQLFFTLGNLHASQSQWAQAQRAYFQAFQSEPGNPDYAFNLAVSLDRLGQGKPALQYYRKAVELSLAQGRAGFDQKAAVARIAQIAALVEASQ